MEHVSTSSPPTPEAFPEPSASSYPPEPEHLENINQPSSPLPPEPFPEPSPSPKPQELEPQPSTSYGTTQTPAKTYELDRSTKPNHLQFTNNAPSHETPVTPAPPITPVTPVTPVPPVTPATQKGKGRGKGKGKTSTLKTQSVVTPNPNDYGPLVPDAIEKALLETEVLNIVMYNNRIQGCYYEKCCHK